MNNENPKDISFKILLKESILCFRKHLYEVLFLAAIPFLAFALLYVYAGDGSIEAILNVPTQIISIIYTLFFFTFIIIIPIIMEMVMGDTKGESLTIKDSFLHIRKKLFKLFFGLFLVISATILLTTIVLIVGSQTGNLTLLSSLFAVAFSCLLIRLYIDFLFLKQAIVLGNLGPIQALKYSRKTVKKSWWKVFNYYFILNLLILVVMNVFSLLLSALLPIPIAYNIVIAFLQSLILLFTQTFITKLYLKLDEI